MVCNCLSYSFTSDSHWFADASNLIGACHYCTEGCPKQIPISEIFSAMNKQLGHGQKAQAIEDYQAVSGKKGKASECINCRQCEKACPQHLPITEHLKMCVKELEK